MGAWRLVQDVADLVALVPLKAPLCLGTGHLKPQRPPAPLSNNTQKIFRIPPHTRSLLPRSLLSHTGSFPAAVLAASKFQSHTPPIETIPIFVLELSRWKQVIGIDQRLPSTQPQPTGAFIQVRYVIDVILLPRDQQRSRVGSRGPLPGCLLCCTTPLPEENFNLRTMRSSLFVWSMILARWNHHPLPWVSDAPIAPRRQLWPHPSHVYFCRYMCIYTVYTDCTRAVVEDDAMIAHSA